MAPLPRPASHDQHHRAAQLANPMLPPASDLIRVGSRRWFLQTGTGGHGGFGSAGALGTRGTGGRGHGRPSRRRSQGGHSVLAFRRAQPSGHVGSQASRRRPRFAGRSRRSRTKLPGVQVCEHLPLQAASWTSCRSFAASIARPAITRRSRCRRAIRWPGAPTTATTAAGYPSMGSIAAKFRGANAADMPPFVGLADSWKADVWGAGHMGGDYEPIQGKELTGRLALPKGIDVPATARPPRPAAAVRPDASRTGARRRSAGRPIATPRWPTTWSSSGRCAGSFDIAARKRRHARRLRPRERRRESAARPAAGRGGRHVRAGQRRVGLLRSSRRRSAMGRHREGPRRRSCRPSIARCMHWSPTWRAAACSTRRSC